jgi:hypothetical protein
MRTMRLADGYRYERVQFFSRHLRQNAVEIRPLRGLVA